MAPSACGHLEEILTPWDSWSLIHRGIGGKSVAPEVPCKPTVGEAVSVSGKTSV